MAQAEATIRDLRQRLYGKQREKSSLPSEAQSGDTTKPPRPRGQTRGSKGHGRTPRPDLPVIEELHVLPLDEQACPLCHAAFDLFPGTEDSEVIEVNVKAYVRKIKRQRYKTCQCPTVPGLITAPPAPRLIPKSSLGVTVWVEVLLCKYLYATPTHRLCADLKNLGAPVAMGTLTGGLKKLAPLFEPLNAALLERHLTERLSGLERYYNWQQEDSIEPGKSMYPPSQRFNVAACRAIHTKRFTRGKYPGRSGETNLPCAWVYPFLTR